jgi:hypothetical protein
VCVCVCVDCVFEKSVGFAAILLLFLLSQILPFVCFATLVVVVPNSPLRVLLHLLLFLLFQIHHFVFLLHLLFLLSRKFPRLVFCHVCCCYSKFTALCFATFVVANFLIWCFATFVVVVPNSLLCVLLHLLFIVLVAPNSPLRDLQLLLLPVLLLLLLHLGSSPPLH